MYGCRNRLYALARVVTPYLGCNACIGPLRTVTHTAARNCLRDLPTVRLFAISAPHPYKIQQAASWGMCKAKGRESVQASALDDVPCADPPAGGIQAKPDSSAVAAEIATLRKTFSIAKSPQETDEALQLGLYVLSSAASDAGEFHPMHVREAALKLLRQIVSTATPSAIHRRIIDDLYTSLLLVDSASPCDLVVAHLKLFESVSSRFAKQRDHDTLGQLASRLQAFCFAGADTGAPRSRTVPLRAAPRDRVQATMAPVNGTVVTSVPIGSFGLSGYQTSSTSIAGSSRHPRRQTSASSLSSVRSSRSDRNVRGPASLNSGSSVVRLAALHALAALAETEWKGLHPHWDLYLAESGSSLLSLLADDDSVDVRVAAANATRQLLQRSVGYLGLARATISKAPFTSLSQSLAGIATRLNQTVAQHASSASPLPVRLAVLELAEAVVTNSPYAHLGPTLLARTIEALLLNVTETNEAILAASLPALATAIPLTVGVGVEQTREGIPTLIERAASTVLRDIKVDSQDSTSRLNASRWRALSALLQRPDCFAASEVYDKVLREIKNTFSIASSEVQLQQIALLAQTTAPGIADRLSAEESMVTPLLLQQALRSVVGTVATTPISAQSTARLSLVALLIGQNVQALRLGQKSDGDALDLLFSILEEGGKGVENSCYRSLGALLASPRILEDPALSSRLLDALLKGVRRTAGQASTQTQAQAMWNMANVCEVPELAESALFDGIQEELVELAIELASAPGASRSVEMSCISSIRVLGVLLSKRPSAVAPTQEQRAISTLCQRLKVPSPKIQWNAATAIKGYLTSSDTPRTLDRLLVNTLLHVLKCDKNIKVRLSALAALLEAHSLRESCSTLPEELAAAIESTEALKDSLPFDEAVRADQLISAVRETRAS